MPPGPVSVRSSKRPVGEWVCTSVSVVPSANVVVVFLPALLVSSSKVCVAPSASFVFISVPFAEYVFVSSRRPLTVIVATSPPAAYA